MFAVNSFIFHKIICESRDYLAESRSFFRRARTPNTRFDALDTLAAEGLIYKSTNNIMFFGP